MTIHPGHFVAIVGGACAGSEAAFQLAQRGIYVAVFDQQALPHGKIEDGLPKWHVKLRDKEENKINEKLSHPNIFYVPKTRMGRDIDFQQFVEKWGFSAVLMACGAWRDRPLPVDGIDAYHGDGFYYQNYFVDWFNHYHEPSYNRHQCEIHDNAIVIGGGLASIDVVKILMLESTARALKKLGHDVDVLSLEHKGIPHKLNELGVKWEDLGINGCTLYYRRRDIDMPLAPLPDDPEKQEKAFSVRQRILKNAQEKYLFNFEDRCKPVDKIIENDRIAGLVFRKTEVANGRVSDIPGSDFSVRSPLVISSIGSIPECIHGVPASGELFAIKDRDTGQMSGYDHVFALGNAVTGRGNIRESALHAQQVAIHVMDEYLFWKDSDFEKVQQEGWDTLSTLPAKRVLSVAQIEQLIERITKYQQRIGYDNDYPKWVEKNRPVRLESLLESE
ncbi:MAG: FAD-dependent oxidoreductase [Calditrichia bacterium]|nr:FAD-dependent oxidoreductase [Calditrichota bacterium]MCB0271094.1 FAD-dependent oxidoreductase [Calditrichota bacterium]